MSSWPMTVAVFADRMWDRLARARCPDALYPRPSRLCFVPDFRGVVRHVFGGLPTVSHLSPDAFCLKNLSKVYFYFIIPKQLGSLE